MELAEQSLAAQSKGAQSKATENLFYAYLDFSHSVKIYSTNTKIYVCYADKSITC